RTAGISDIRRFAGQDRYETSVKIAQEISSKTAVLATGLDFPDALSISVPAAQLGMPILLTRQNTLPETVNEYLLNGSVTKTYLIGGEGVISKDVADSVPAPCRLSGANRYLTNISIIKNFESGLDFKKIYVADGGGPRGNEFADALAGAVLAAKTNSPLILADNTLPTTTGTYFLPKINTTTQVVGLGGENAVPMSLLQSIPNLLITKEGTLNITPTRLTTGKTTTFTLTYTLEENFSNGTLEFVFPGGFTVVQGQYLVNAKTNSLSYSNKELSDSGLILTVSGINGKSGGKIDISLVDKKIPMIGNYKFKVLADSDGLATTKLPNSGSVNATKSLIVNSPELKAISVQLIKNNRSYSSLNPVGFVIHSTATPGATAQSIYNYFNSAYRAASAHYTTDWNELVQLIPENEVAWHAGKTANSRYLSIEMCEPEGTNPQEFQKVWDHTVLLVADACVRYNWDVKTNVFSHYTISYTYKETDHTDPIGFLAKYNRTWDQLLQAIDAKVKELS
ncbi:MAG: cell wall-binding repeat-containing protein, partial [Eubacteriales bacterium]